MVGNSVAPVTKDKLRIVVSSGRVQGGLKTCAGEITNPESKSIGEVVDAVNEAIKKRRHDRGAWCIKNKIVAKA